MWLALGAGAVVFTVLNLIRLYQDKDPKWFRFAGISLTALTACSFYSDEAMRVVKEDWSGLMDTMPVMSKVLWVCVILSILVNGISLIQEKK